METTGERRAREWLFECGAGSVSHAGGSLAEHLDRVYERLGSLGLREPVRLAGLVHAAYGTDGFALSLLDVADRRSLRELVGEEAESIVYRYGGCDRGHTWQALASTGLIRSRFTGAVEAPGPNELRDFVNLTIVNEVDVAEHDPQIATRHGDYFRGLFAGWSAMASPSVLADARRVLAF